MKTMLNERDLTALRTQGTLHAEETAYWMGDKLIAENVLTQARRIIEAPSLVLESKRGLLKG